MMRTVEKRLLIFQWHQDEINVTCAIFEFDCNS